jgi:hypothetical protein
VTDRFLLFLPPAVTMYLAKNRIYKRKVEYVEEEKAVFCWGKLGGNVYSMDVVGALC